MPRGLRGWISLLLAGVPFLFPACDSADHAAPPEPVSALYECRGTAPYAASWDEILKGLDSSGAVYCAPPPFAAVDTLTAVPLDTVQMRIVVLDGQCRLLEAYDHFETWVKGADFPFWFWDGRMADGSDAPTGEYFINTVWKWRDGRRDTTWAKSGFVRTRCGSSARMP